MDEPFVVFDEDGNVVAVIDEGLVFERNEESNS
mgnify:CR=1 FL=1